MKSRERVTGCCFKLHCLRWWTVAAALRDREIWQVLRKPFQDAAVQSADFLAKQPDAETAIQKELLPTEKRGPPNLRPLQELHKAREWAAQACD